MATKRARTRLTYLALFLASALVVVLSIQNQRLKERSQSWSLQAKTLTRGSYVLPVTLLTLSGDSIVLGEGTRQVLAFLSTSCPFCTASIPAWDWLEDRLSGRADTELVLVSLDSLEATAEFLEESKLGAPVALLLEPRIRSAYRANTVPQTVVVESNGRVTFSWPETFTTRAADSLLASLPEPSGANRENQDSRQSGGLE